MPISIPTITTEELLEFHHRHYSSSAQDAFQGTFLQQNSRLPANNVPSQEVEPEEVYEEYYEEGDLGYYEDGTKRTLTDEQIAIFRHSEVWKAYKEKLKADAAAQANLAAQLPEIDTAEPHVPLKRKHVQEDNSDLPYDDGDVGNWTERRLQDDGQPPKKGKVGGNSAPNQVYRDGFAWPVLGANNDN